MMITFVIRKRISTNKYFFKKTRSLLALTSYDSWVSNVFQGQRWQCLGHQDTFMVHLAGLPTWLSLVRSEAGPTPKAYSHLSLLTLELHLGLDSSLRAPHSHASWVPCIPPLALGAPLTWSGRLPFFPWDRAAPGLGCNQLSPGLHITASPGCAPGPALIPSAHRL